MTPNTTGIDAITKEKDTIIILQVATGQEDYLKAKFKDFKRFIAEELQPIIKPPQKLIPWFLSHNDFSVSEENTMDYNGLLTNGAFLEKILTLSK